MPILVMDDEKWVGAVQAFVQERNDCEILSYMRPAALFSQNIEVIKEFIELCELIDLTPY